VPPKKKALYWGFFILRCLVPNIKGMAMRIKIRAIIISIDNPLAVLGIWLGDIKPIKNPNNEQEKPKPAISHIPIVPPGTL